MKSLSRLAPRVSRCRKTGVLSGLWQEAIPKHGGDYSGVAQIERWNRSTRKPYISSSKLALGSDSPTSRQLIKKQILLNHLHTMKSLSRLAPRVSRCRKTGVLSGLWQEAIPKPGGEYSRDTPKNNFTFTHKNPAHCHYILNPPFWHSKS